MNGVQRGGIRHRRSEQALDAHRVGFRLPVTDAASAVAGTADLHGLEAEGPPLAVDLDGTLVQADTLHEAVLACARDEPLALHRLGRGLRQGKAAFKRAASSGRVAFDPSLLPYNQAVARLPRGGKGRPAGGSACSPPPTSPSPMP